MDVTSRSILAGYHVGSKGITSSRRRATWIYEPSLARSVLDICGCKATYTIETYIVLASVDDYIGFIRVPTLWCLEFRYFI